MIKIRLEKWENTVIMQVLEMDEHLRGVGEIFRNDSDMVLKSYVLPEITETSVYIGGEEKRDDRVVDLKTFISNVERDIYYNKVVELFNDYNCATCRNYNNKIAGLIVCKLPFSRYCWYKFSLINFIKALFN